MKASWNGIRLAIAGMGSLPEDDPNGIDAETGSHAAAFVDYLEASGLDVPDLVAHGGDVTFVWTRGERRRHVNVCGDEVWVAETAGGVLLQEWDLRIDTDEGRDGLTRLLRMG